MWDVFCMLTLTPVYFVWAQCICMILTVHSEFAALQKNTCIKIKSIETVVLVGLYSTSEVLRLDCNTF